MSEIILRPKAQFGNILFQYAFAKSISIQMGGVPIFVDRTFGGVILVELGLAQELERLPYSYRILYRHRHIVDKILNKTLKITPFGYTPIIQNGSNPLGEINLNKKVAIHGRFQDYNLFQKHSDIIRESIRRAILDYAGKDNIEIQKGELAVHVRRGDYLENKYLQSIGALNRDFYSHGITRILSEHDVTAIKIFTDDPSHQDVVDLMRTYNCTCATGNWLEDFTGMMSSEYILISNSTFSWWSAFLSENSAPEKIYAPIPFTVKHAELHNRVLPQTWNVLPSTWIKPT